MAYAGAAVLAALVCGTASAQDEEQRWIGQDFDSWDVEQPAWNTWETYTHTDGWSVVDAWVGDLHALAPSRPVAPTPTNAVWLQEDGDSDSYVMTPPLPEGFGSVSFWHMNYQGTDNRIAIEFTTNGAPWQTAEIVSPSIQDVWQYYSNSLPIYDAAQLRIRKIHDGQTGLRHQAIDDIVVTEPPSKVDVTNLGTIPSPPLSDTPIHFEVDINPFASSSNIAATIYYRIGTSGAFIPLGMVTNGAPTHYQTVIPIPAQSLGTTVEWYLEVLFEGYDPTGTPAPRYIPAGAPATPATFVVFRVRDMDSGYDSLSVAGSYSDELFLTGDYAWQGVAELGSPTVDPTFTFEGTGASSESWGDDDQVYVDLPVFGMAEAGAASDIRVDGTQQGAYVFDFHEGTLQYQAQKCAYQNADAWGDDAAVDDYTFDGWTLVEGRTTTTGEQAKAFGGAGRAVILWTTGTEQYLMSPPQPEGIGEIGFRYRNFDDTGFQPTEFSVQVSRSGMSDWVTLAVETNVVAGDYVHLGVELQDRHYRYVRILNSTAAPQSPLLLDEIVVAEPQAAVLVNNVIHTPQNPSVLDTIKVEADLFPWARASNLSVATLYRAGTSGLYASIPMTNSSGNTYVTTANIPRGDIGTMQYLIQYTFDDPNEAGPRTQVFPPDVPLEYQNSDVAQSTVQNFDSWDNPPATWATWGDYSNTDGWSVVQGSIGDNGARPDAPSMPNAGWLRDTDMTGSIETWIQSPLLPEGMEFLSFRYLAYQVGAVIDVQYSTDGTNYSTIATITDAVNDQWLTYSDKLDLFDPGYLRIRRRDDSERFKHVGIDNIVVDTGLPPTDMVLSDVMIHPGYPSRDEHVIVECNVTYLNPQFDPLNITPRVFYRIQGQPWDPEAWVLMTEASDRFYSTPVGIPPQPGRSTIEYYVECTFSGYKAASNSPAYFPTNFAIASQPLTFEVRPFSSEYGSMLMSFTNGAQTALELVGDKTWSTVLTFDNPVNGIEFNMTALNQYDGTTYLSNTNTWGDSFPTRDALPLAGVMQPGASNIVLNEQLSGQFVFTFSHETLLYTARRCRFQNFDEWEADPVWFEETPGLPVKTFDTTFDGWPLSETVYSLPEDYQNDLDQPNPEFYWDPYLSFNLWYIRDALIFDEMPGVPTPIITNRATRLMDYENRGEVWPLRSVVQVVDGLEEFSFRHRSTIKDDHVSWYQLGLPWQNYSVNALVNATQLSPEFPYIALVAGYLSPFDHFEFRMQRLNVNSQVMLSLWQVRAGQETMLSETGPFSGDLLDADQGASLTFSLNNAGNVYLEAVYDGNSVEGYASVGASDYQFGPGSVGVRAWDATMSADNIRVTSRLIQRFANWTSGASMNGWEVTDGAVNGTYCELQPGPGPTLRTPELTDLGNNAEVMTFLFANATGSGIGQLTVEGSDDGIVWNPILTVNDITSTAYQSKQVDLTTPYAYLRLQSTSPTASVRIDDIYIRGPVGDVLPTQSFSSGLGNWNTAGGSWDVVGQELVRLVPEVGLQIQYAPTNSSGPWGPAPAAWSNKTEFTVDNLDWDTHTERFEDWRSLFVRVHHTSEDVSLAIDDLQISSWHGEEYQEDGWKASEAWFRNWSGGVATEFRRSRANPDVDQGVRSPWMTNGVGRITAYYMVEIPPAVVDVQRSFPVAVGTNEFFTVQSFTNTTVGWVTNTVNIRTNENMYVRFRHIGAESTASIVMTNLTVTDWPQTDENTWFAYNALITEEQDTRELEPGEDKKSAFLNFDESTGARFALTEDEPYIQSAILSNGVGEVTFWYKNWENDGTPSANIFVRASETDSFDPTNWFTIAELRGIANTDEYLYFSTNFYLPEYKYLRVYCETNSGLGTAARAAVDNILIAEPLAANLEIGNVVLLPQIPLTGDRVRVRATLANFVLEPQNRNARLGYYVGTAPWGDWPSTNWIDMAVVSFDGRNEVWEVPQGQGIGPFPVDTVVQYVVEASFTGLFAERSSPKLYREFTNPAWYYPRDLNEELGTPSTVTPYYFVFSSMPGEVWINEVDWLLLFGDFYVELAGPAGVEIGNWKIDLVDPEDNLFNSVTITNGIGSPFENETDGFGFLLYGAPSATLPAALVDYEIKPGPGGTPGMLTSGGVRLTRSMGAYERRVSYGFAGPDLIDNGYEYIGQKTFFQYSLYLDGTGNGLTNDFTWLIASSALEITPGAVNLNQTLVAGETNISPDLAEIWITDFDVGAVLTVITATGTNGWTPRPWFTTNLNVLDSWMEVTPYSYGGYIGDSGPGPWTIEFNTPAEHPRWYRIDAIRN